MNKLDQTDPRIQLHYEEYLEKNPATGEDVILRSNRKPEESNPADIMELGNRLVLPRESEESSNQSRGLLGLFGNFNTFRSRLQKTVIS